MRIDTKEKRLERQCQDFNHQFPVGTQVRYFPIIGGSDYRVSKIKHAAYVLSGHSSVCFIEKQAGCVSIDAIEPCSIPCRICPTTDQCQSRGCLADLNKSYSPENGKKEIDSK